jgi:hypothetical protein
MKNWIKKVFSDGDQPSSKRSLAAYFSIVLTIAIFTKVDIGILYALMGFIATLLGITEIKNLHK